METNRPALFAYLALSAIYFAYFKRNGLGNDFEVFFQAGSLVSNGLNPYGWSSDPTSNSFLYGPINALFAALVSQLNYSVALSLLYISFFILIPISVFLIHSFFFPQDRRNQHLWLLSCLILLTFPTRAAFLYGQLVPVYFTIFVIAAWLLRKSNSFAYLCGGLLVGLCVDFKPHVFAIMSLIFWQKGIRFYFGVGIILFCPFLAFGNSAHIYLQWLEAIKLRGGAGLGGPDLTGVYSFFLQSQLPIHLFFLIAALAIILIFAIFSTRSLSFCDKSLFLIFILLVFNPFTHVQDLLPFIFILLFHTGISSGFIKSFIMGLCFVWSPNLTTNLALATVIVALLLIANRSKCVNVSQLGILVPIFVIQIIDIYTKSQTIYFTHFIIQLINLYITLIYFHYLRYSNSRYTNLSKAIFGSASH